jgi:hypothetical protein
MSDLNVTVAPVKPLEIAKEGTNTPTKDMRGVEETRQAMKTAPSKEQQAKSVEVKLTDLNYSIDPKDNALHLKVKKADGELVREVVFDRIDPGLLDTKKLKGIFIDGNI